jgi:membrane-bound lytic murein transglycosylase D
MLMKNFGIIILGVVVLLFGLGHILEKSSGEISTPAIPSVALHVPYFETPGTAELCGEPVPLDIMDVRERFDREFTIVVHSHAQVYLWMKRAERHLPWIEKQLEVNGLPDDLKYVAIAESDLMSSAYSPAGAAGPWQFISATGKRYGLRQSEGLDERYDFELATESAFRYLKDLYSMFNNWTLSIAAYNCGENRVQNELRRQRTAAYYNLKLPLETERYIFRILAIKEVLSHPERYGYALPKGAGYPVLTAEKVTMDLPNSIPVIAAADAAGVGYRDFKVMNPSFTSNVIPPGSHGLKVPAGRGKDFVEKLEAAKGSYEPELVHHKVDKGETLSGIASSYKVNEQDICKWNSLQGDKIRVGQVLKIYKCTE